MKVTEDKMLQLSNQMMTEENTDPHYCQECGRGMGVNPGGDGGDASPPLFGVGGTPILIVPPTFCQGWIQV